MPEVITEKVLECEQEALNFCMKIQLPMLLAGPDGVRHSVIWETDVTSSRKLISVL